MGLSAAVGIGASLISSSASKKASKSASKTQAEGTAAEIAELRRQFDLSREDLRPQREASEFALERLINLISNPGQVVDLPGFDFRRQQGREVLEEGAASRGGLFSGNTLQALEEFGQNFATGELGGEFNRLSTLAGIAVPGVQTGVQAGGASANAIANSLRSGAGAQAQQQLNQGSISANLINSIGNNAIFAGRLGAFSPRGGGANLTQIPAGTVAPGLVGFT